MARPVSAAHEPSDASRRQVQAMAGYGIPQEKIAKILGISEKTLRKNYRRELDLGLAIVTTAVADSLFKKALGEGKGSVAAAIFLLKTRARWSEKPDEADPDSPLAIPAVVIRQFTPPPPPKDSAS